MTHKDLQKYEGDKVAITYKTQYREILNLEGEVKHYGLSLFAVCGKSCGRGYAIGAPSILTIKKLLIN